MIVNSLEVVRNNVKLSHVIFFQFSSMVTFCKTIVYNALTLFRLPVLSVLVCVCMYVHVFSSIKFCHLHRFTYPSLQLRS